MADGLQPLRLQPQGGEGATVVGDHLPGATPCLVFLHGMTTARWGQKSQGLLARARAMGTGFACIDFRGHGESDGHLDTLTISDLLADVDALVEAVGPVVLCGSSMGALAAAWYAARRPAQVRALALLSPAFGFIPLMAAKAGSGEPFPLIRSDEEVVHLVDAVLQDARQYDETELPGKLGMPVFCAHGTADRTVPYQLSEAFCAAVPHLRKELWLIEEGSHSLGEDVDALLDNLCGFLDRYELT